VHAASARRAEDPSNPYLDPTLRNI